MAHTVAPAPPIIQTSQLGAGWSKPPLQPNPEPGYGPALPVVYGTDLCTARVVWCDWRGLSKEPVNDAWQFDEHGVPSQTAKAYVMSAALAVCEGPADFGRFYVQGQTRPKQLHYLGRGSVGTATWVRGTGSETVWTRCIQTTGPQETFAAMIPMSAPYTVTVPDPATWFANVRVTRPPVNKYPSADPGVVFDAVAANPVGGQYAVANGVYTFAATDGGTTLSILFQRATTVAGLNGSAIPLRRTAHIRVNELALVDKNSLPTPQIEVVGYLAKTLVTKQYSDGAGAYEAHPADVIVDMLTSFDHGLGLGTDQVDVDYGPDGLEASGYRRYCTAMGWTVSRSIDSTTDTKALLADLLTCTNSIAVWSAGVLRILPNGDQVVGSYAPPSVAYAIGVDDLIVSDASDPIQATRTLPGDVYNCWPVSYRDRSAWYEEVTTDDPIDDPTQELGVRRAQVTSLPWVRRGDMAQQLSRLLAQRSVYCRNTYSFTLSPQWSLLEPGDIVAITEPVTGLDEARARVRSMEVGEDGAISVEAEEYPDGIGHVVTLVQHSADGMIHGLGSSSWDSSRSYEGVGSGHGTNLLYNSDFSQGWPVDQPSTGGGWSTYVSVSGLDPYTNINLAQNLPNIGANASLSGSTDPKNTEHLNTLGLAEYGRFGSVDEYTELVSPKVSVRPAARYAGSMYVASYGARTDLYLEWLQRDGTGSTVQRYSYPNGTNGAGSSGYANSSNAEANAYADFKTLDHYKRLFVLDNAPSDAAYAVLHVRKWDTKAGGGNSVAACCRAQIEEVGWLATLPGPWVPSSAGVVNYDGQRFAFHKVGTNLSEQQSAWFFTFDTPEPDADYIVTPSVVGSTGSPPANAFIVKGVTKQADEFIVLMLAAPGTGNSITLDVAVTGARAATGFVAQGPPPA